MNDEDLTDEDRLFLRATAKLERLAKDRQGDHSTLVEFVREIAGENLYDLAEAVDELLEDTDAA